MNTPCLQREGLAKRSRRQERGKCWRISRSSLQAVRCCSSSPTWCALSYGWDADAEAPTLRERVQKVLGIQSEKICSCLEQISNLNIHVVASSLLLRAPLLLANPLLTISPSPAFTGASFAPFRILVLVNFSRAGPPGGAAVLLCFINTDAGGI